jgi:hypothetical protein
MTATVTEPTTETAELAARAILGLVAAHPGTFGRMRTARLVSGHAVPLDDPDIEATTATYTGVARGWALRDAVGLVDALIHGGLIAQTNGPRPTLALTRAGFRALDALDPESQAASGQST